MCASFDNLALIHDDDAVGIADGAQSVSDDNYRSVFFQLFVKFLEFTFGFIVKRGGRCLEVLLLNQDDICFSNAIRRIFAAITKNYEQIFYIYLFLLKNWCPKEDIILPQLLLLCRGLEPSHNSEVVPFVH